MREGDEGGRGGVRVCEREMKEEEEGYECARGR